MESKKPSDGFWVAAWFGTLNAVIDRRYPLELLPDAHKYVETERKKVM